MKSPIVVSSRDVPTCGRMDCDPGEQPEHWVDVELTEDVKTAIKKAKAALVGDSNDAEHDALFGLIRALGEGTPPECKCNGPEVTGRHSLDCPCVAWEEKK